MVSRSEGRHPIRESAELGWFIVRNWFKPGRKSMVPYSIQWLMRFKPAWFRHDLLTLLDLLKQGKIKPLIAQRLPLEEARRAHEMLGEGGVLGKIVLLPEWLAKSCRGHSTRIRRAPDCSFRNAARPPTIETRTQPVARQFDVVIERDSEGYYVASVPQIPSCHIQARSLDELNHRIREAIPLCLEAEGTPERN